MGNRKHAYVDTDAGRLLFRSSWEAMFFVYLNEEYSDCFETTRIKYEFGGKTRTYIVDFTSHALKTLFEVKPRSNQRDEKEAAKLAAGRAYAESTGYDFIVIDETWLVEHRQALLDACSHHTHLVNVLKKIRAKRTEDDRTE